MDWKELQGAAPELDRRLRSSEHRTLVHGDFKAANLHFGKDAQGQPLCAAYDFQ
jgi:Ser/Thr protein kinase RdoA (MazF antagonist)